MMSKISEGLERAFASRGFAEPSVEDLRDAAGVSLRTLYKYTPSRAEMVLAALENRHQRYLTQVFEGLPKEHDEALATILSRVGMWMATETSHGCLFHAAVAADPESLPFATFSSDINMRSRSGPRRPPGSLEPKQNS
ncbi:TetR/AcrR family transcriptional regulator (plasmid) [Aquicoccus sp. G2-2]|uniref:TetR/AcrR family transcriptional regulator n=1 Tax=Aquicoccus sp. G2-2 TaxID=3092120 RepID=UPI00367203EA